MRLQELADFTRRETEHAKLHSLPSLLVDVELLAELFRGNVPVGGNEFPPEKVNAMLYDEKARRIYYQDIVYAVSNSLDKIFAKRPGNGIVCGTNDNPTKQVQEHMAIVVDRCGTLAKIQAAQEPPDCAFFSPEDPRWWKP